MRPREPRILPVCAFRIHCAVGVLYALSRVRERSQPGAARAAESVPSLASMDQPPASLELEALVARARAPGADGRTAHAALRAALSTLAPSDAHGRALSKLLDDGAFNDLIADDGSLTRELAVEALLRLGYPWALQVHPDELAWYRSSVSQRARNRRVSILLGILAAELLVWAALSVTW